MNKRRWRIRYAAPAQRDIARILAYTYETFGTRQAATYKQLIQDALRDIAANPTLLGSKPRDDILQHLRTLHIARGGRRGRHLILYRPDQKTRVIDILHIIHDASDIERHVDDWME